VSGSKSWAEAKKAHRNTVLSTTITLRGDLVDEVDRLEEEMVEAAKVDKTENREPEAPRIAERIQDIEREAAESEVEFTFRGLGRGQFAKLIADHPPRADGERDLFEATDLPYNAETFPPALMAMCCISPAELAGDLGNGKIDEQVLGEWREIHDEWNAGQVTDLWRTCLATNTGVGTTPKSRAASALLALRNSENNSPTA
jgi:hypothetical protein